jgi:hypothetical protein
MGFGIKLIDGISQANDQEFKVLAGKDVDLTEAADFGGALADADLILVDDAAAGTQASTKKSALSRVWTYIQAKIAGTANIIDSNQYVDGSIDTVHIGDNQVTEDKLADSLLAEIDANTDKATNVSTNLGKTTHVSQITINSSDGDNVVIAEASDTIAGVMTVAHHDKLDGIEASATADQSNAEIRTAVEAATDSNVFTDADHTKLNGIEASATADQSNAEILTAIENSVDSVHYVDGSIDTVHIGDDQVTEAKLANSLLAEIDANTAKVTNVATDLTATANGTSLTINSSDGSNVALPAATNSAWGIMSDDLVVALEANTAKNTNVVGNLSATANGTSLTVETTNGSNVALPAADTDNWGVMTDEMFDAIAVNTSKATNVDTDLTATANGTSLTINSSDGDNVALPAATNSAWGIMSDDHVVALEANTAKNTNVVGNLSVTANGTSLTVETSNGSNVALPAADTDNWGVMTDEMFDAIAANTVKSTNVSTDLSVTTSTTTVRVDSSDGTNATIPVATTSIGGVMSKAIFDQHTANVDKNTNVSTDLTATANGTSLTINSSDGDNVALPAATTSAWGVMTDDHATAIEANTDKTSFSNLTGEVTSSGAATTISDGVVDEANLKVSNDPTDGHVLSAQSGNTGGLTWVAAGSGGTNVTLTGSRDYITISGQEITRNAIDLTADVTGVLPSANLDTDTARLSGTQNFTGAKVFSAGITPSFIKHSISGNGAADYGPGADILYGIGDDDVTAGAIYVLRGDTTGWVLMNAALASSSRQLCAVATVAAGNGDSSDGMLIRGCVTLAAAIDGTDIEGHQIYASTTAGYAAIAPPTASGNGIRVLGYSLNVGSKKIFFDPDKTWLEI